MELETFVGKVVWFSGPKNYGFISRENEKDLFVHFSDIEMEGYKTLKEEQIVSFSIGKNNRGEPKAIHVKIINVANR